MKSLVFAMVMLAMLGATIVWARITPELLHPVVDGPIALPDGSESSARQRGHASDDPLAANDGGDGWAAAGAGMQAGRAGHGTSDDVQGNSEGLDPATRTAVVSGDVVDLVLDRGAARGAAEPARDGTDLWTSERGTADLSRQGSPMREGGTSRNEAVTQTQPPAAATRTAEGIERPREAAFAGGVRMDSVPGGARGSTPNMQNGDASDRSWTSPAVLADDSSGDAGGDAVMAGGEARSTNSDRGDRRHFAGVAPESRARPSAMNVDDSSSVAARDDRGGGDEVTARAVVAADATMPAQEAVRAQEAGTGGGSANGRNSGGAWGMPRSEASIGAGEAQPVGPVFSRPRLSGIDMSAASQTSLEAGRERVSVRAETVRSSDGLADPLILAPPTPARLSDTAAQAFAEDVERGVAAYRAGDYAAAAGLWRPAAEADVAKAQFHMGGMTLEGRLAAPDPLAAYLWLDRAYANGFSAAEPLLRAAEQALRPADRTALESLLGRPVDRES